MAFISNLAQRDSNSYVTVATADDYFSNRLGSDAWGSASNNDKQAALVMATRDIDNNRFLGWKFRRHQSLQFPRLYRRDTVAHYHTGRDGLSKVLDHFTGAAKTITDASNIIFDTVLQTGDFPSSKPDDWWKNGQIEITSGTGKGQVKRIKSSSATTGNIETESAFSPAPDTTSQFIVFQDVPDIVKRATYEQALFRLKNQTSVAADVAAQGIKRIRVGEASTEYFNVQEKDNLSREAKDIIDVLISRTGRIT